MNTSKFVIVSGVTLVGLALLAGDAAAQGSSIYQATLAEPSQKTQEVSTEEVRRILTDRSAIILDSRKHSEFVAGHIPGAQNVDAPPSAAVATIERLVNGDKSKALVLYCNGPFCQASRRLSEQLVVAGFINVRRFAAIPTRYTDLARTRRADRDRAGRDCPDIQSRPDCRIFGRPVP